MSLFGSLNVGTSGLKVSQYGLNVVAHNLANVDTEGYVRQQVVLNTAMVSNIGSELKCLAKKHDKGSYYMLDRRA